MILGNWSIDYSLYQWIVDNVKDGKVILELGSGNATEYLSKKWKMISIEEDQDWIDKFDSNYIFAPIKNDWYDIDSIVNNLPKKVDVILIDGPAHGKRIGFFENLDIFLKLRPSILIFDDVERQNDFECYKKSLDRINSEFVTETNIFSSSKKFAIIRIKYSSVSGIPLK